MNIYEVMKYAQSINQEVEFKFTNLKGEEVFCKTLDCYFGLFEMGNVTGFIIDKEWHKNFGETFQFEIINQKG